MCDHSWQSINVKAVPALPLREVLIPLTVPTKYQIHKHRQNCESPERQKIYLHKMKSQERPFTPGWRNEYCPAIKIELMWKLVLGKLDCLVQLLFRPGCSRYLSCWQRWKENIWGAKRTFCCQLAPFSSFLAHTVTFVSTVTCNSKNKYFICCFISHIT